MVPNGVSMTVVVALFAGMLLFLEVAEIIAPKLLASPAKAVAVTGATGGIHPAVQIQFKVKATDLHDVGIVEFTPEAASLSIGGQERVLGMPIHTTRATPATIKAGQTLEFYGGFALPFTLTDEDRRHSIVLRVSLNRALRLAFPYDDKRVDVETVDGTPLTVVLYAPRPA